jgi:hypothetical protein
VMDPVTAKPKAASDDKEEGDETFDLRG